VQRETIFLKPTYGTPRLTIATPVLSMVVSFGCDTRSVPAVHEEGSREQTLALTLGGFLRDGPESEKISGVCGTDVTRNVLNCDVYSGLPEWTVTEVTMGVTVAPYEKDDARFYQVPILIKPRTTERIAIRLGLQLPPDNGKRPNGRATKFPLWGWQIEGAKGYPAK
jgi:hypothetical protein